jgi:uncharacterized membrane protein YukC
MNKKHPKKKTLVNNLSYVLFYVTLAIIFIVLIIYLTFFLFFQMKISLSFYRNNILFPLSIYFQLH